MHGYIYMKLDFKLKSECMILYYVEIVKVGMYTWNSCVYHAKVVVESGGYARECLKCIFGVVAV